MGSASEQAKGDGWKDKSVCKRFLVQYCPTDKEDNWFRNTRRDPGACFKVHSDRLKADFEKHPDKERYRYDYEKEFLEFCEKIVEDAEAWIKREKANCVAPGKRLKMNDGIKQKIADMQDRSEILFCQAEDLASKGEVSASKQASAESASLKEEIKKIKEDHSYESVGEIVCEVCGVRCNPDEQADYQAHMDGKVHAAYTTIRNTVKELREKLKNGRPAGAEKDEKKDEVSRRRRRDSDDEDDKKDRRKDKDRDADRDRSKRDRRSRDRSRDRRSRDRSRSRDRRRR